MVVYRQILEAVQKYAINTLFDSVNTLMGVILGTFLLGNATVRILVTSILTTSVALGISSGTSTFEAERLEQDRKLKEIEMAMIQEFDNSILKKNARKLVGFVGIVNFLTPVLIATMVISVLLLVFNLVIAIFIALGLMFTVLFLAGFFFGKVNQLSPFKHAFRMFGIGIATALVSFVLSFFL